MSIKDFQGFHEDLAELMIADVESWGGELTPAHLQRLERLAMGAVAPEMLAGVLAVSAARARHQLKAATA